MYRHAAAAFTAITLTLACQSVDAGALERIKSNGRVTFGYVANAQPFSFKNDKGDAEGYSIGLCERIATSIGKQLALPGLTVEWKPVDAERRVRAVESGEIDLLCTPMRPTLDLRQSVSFSIPVFPGGNRAAVRSDAPATLRDVLTNTSGRHPAWAGSPVATNLGNRKVGMVAETSSEGWLAGRRDALGLETDIVSVPSYRKGLDKLLAGDIDVLFGERVLMLGVLAGMDAKAREGVVILDRLFTQEATALALERNGDEYRLLVDRALSELYASDEFVQLYRRWAGEFNEQARAFFAWNAVGR